MIDPPEQSVAASYGVSAGGGYGSREEESGSWRGWRGLLWLELGILFGLVPAGLWLAREAEVFPLGPIPVLLVALAYAVSHLPEKGLLWNAGPLRREWGRIVVLAGMAAVVMAGLTLLLVPGQWLQLPSQSPGRWALILLLYPLLSVWPQEVIYRAFFFARYGRLMGAWALPWASAAAFAWAHVFFGSAWAVVLSFPAGLAFALTYARTRSTAAATAEHTLWGCLAFTIGVGVFFVSV